jgi:hypothetical protein
MRKTTSIAVLILIVAAIAFGQTTTTTTVTGFLTDTACGKRGATALHIDCPKRKVAAGTAKYALYDEASKRLYVLACTAPSAQAVATNSPDQSCVEQYLGQRVKITGTLTESRLTRAGQVLAPDDTAATSSTSSTSTTTSSSELKVVSLPRSLDSTTPIAGILTISSVETVQKR